MTRVPAATTKKMNSLFKCIGFDLRIVNRGECSYLVGGDTVKLEPVAIDIPNLTWRDDYYPVIAYVNTILADIGHELI